MWAPSPRPTLNPNNLLPSTPPRLSCCPSHPRPLCSQFGEEAVKEGMGGGGGGGPADIFDLFGMGGGGRRAQPRERRSEDVVHK